MSKAYISIGSNLGDRLGYIREAIRKMMQSKEIRITKASSVYETQPVYGERSQTIEYEDQPWFLNLVLELETNLAPLNLLELLSNIEKQMERTRPALRPENQCRRKGSPRRKRTDSPSSLQAQRYGPRNIDLDLLLYDDLVLNSDRLTLPHPRMHEREFVLVPLAEIAPKAIHPLLKKTVEKILEELSTESYKDEFGVRLYSKRAF